MKWEVKTQEEYERGLPSRGGERGTPGDAKEDTSEIYKKKVYFVADTQSIALDQVVQECASSFTCFGVGIRGPKDTDRHH